MSAPPPVPERSRLRDAPPPKIDTARDAFSSPRLSAGNPNTSVPVTPSTPDLCVPAIPTTAISPLSPYFRKASLQVDSVNPSTTPRLRSPSTPSFTFPSSLLGSPSGSGPLSSFAKKRQSKVMEKDPRDPYKVKDGMQKKKAASGIYTRKSHMFLLLLFPRPILIDDLFKLLHSLDRAATTCLSHNNPTLLTHRARTQTRAWV